MRKGHSEYCGLPFYNKRFPGHCGQVTMVGSVGFKVPGKLSVKNGNKNLPNDNAITFTVFNSLDVAFKLVVKKCCIVCRKK